VEILRGCEVFDARESCPKRSCQRSDLIVASCAPQNHAVLLSAGKLQNAASAPRIVLGIEKFPVPQGAGRLPLAHGLHKTS
jgi:hypothetical protein